MVIASSDLLKKEADDLALAERGGVNHVSELMIPKGPAEVRRFASLVVYKPPKFMPDFVVRDVLMVCFSSHREFSLMLLILNSSSWFVGFHDLFWSPAGTLFISLFNSVAYFFSH